MSITLNKQALKRGDTLPVLMFAYFLSEEKIKTTFKEKTGLTIDSLSDIEALSEIVNKKMDASGVLKNGSNPIIFSAMDVLKIIRYSEKEKEKVKEIILE